MIFDQSNISALLNADKTPNHPTAMPKQDEARQYVVLKRYRSWHVKWRGRFSAPYSSEAKAVRDAVASAKRSCKKGKLATVAIFTKQSGLKTIWTYDPETASIESKVTSE